MTHTKGPWDIGGVNGGGLPHTVYCDDATGSAVAKCDFEFVNRSKEELRANARLIAAAPDLLEALEMSLQAYDYGHTGPKATIRIAKFEEKASAAIAKAKGTPEAGI